MILIDVKKSLAFLILFLGLSLCANVKAHAQRVATGTPSVYKVTMIKFEISPNSGTTWTTIAGTQTIVDIASVSAGQSVGNWISGGSFPVGIYNLLRHTISATFTMRGYVYYNTTNTTYFTTAAGISSVAGNVTDTSLMTNYGEQAITIADDGVTISGGRIVSTETDDLTITAGTTLTERISFDVRNTLGLYNIGGGNYAFFPEQPVVDSTE